MKRRVWRGDLRANDVASDGFVLLGVAVVVSAAKAADRALLARGHLAGLSGGCALTAAVAAPLAAPASGWTGPALVVVVATVLVLRARAVADPAISRVHLAAETAAGSHWWSLPRRPPEGPAASVHSSCSAPRRPVRLRSIDGRAGRRR